MESTFLGSLSDLRRELLKEGLKSLRRVDQVLELPSEFLLGKGKLSEDGINPLCVERQAVG